MASEFGGSFVGADASPRCMKLGDLEVLRIELQPLCRVLTIPNKVPVSSVIPLSSLAMRFS